MVYWETWEGRAIKGRKGEVRGEEMKGGKREAYGPNGLLILYLSTLRG